MTGPADCTADLHAGDTPDWSTRRYRYKLGCRCTEALDACARYQRHLSYDHLQGKRRMLDATGTQRRVLALMCMGWDQARIGAMYGVTSQQVGAILARDKTTARTAERIAAIYEQLWNVPGPSARAKLVAAKRGGLPPMWWDDDQLDDPDYDPRKDVVAPVQIRDERRQERLERVARLVEVDRLSIRQVALKLGMHDRQVSRDLADWRKGTQTVEQLEAAAS